MIRVRKSWGGEHVIGFRHVHGGNVNHQQSDIQVFVSDGISPYPDYKDSGIAWLGQIPSHWDVNAVRRDFDIQLGKMLQPTPNGPDDSENPYFKAQHVKWEAVQTTGLPFMWARPVDEVKYGVRNGDLLVCEGGEVGRAGVVFNPPDRAIIQNALHRVRSLGTSDIRLLMYLLQHIASQGWFDILCNRATIAHFTSEKFGDLPIPVPPITEQRAIAAFLDRETARIDALVAKKEQLIELLQEKRAALISHVVTRGLDSNVPTEDSGVDWLGEVPAHWEVKPIGALARTGHKTFTDGDWIEAPFITRVGIRLIQTGNIGIGHYKEKGFRYVSDDTFRALQCTEVIPGDILICRLAEPVGRACLAPDLACRMITSVDVCIIKPKKDMCPGFVVYALSASDYLSYIGAICRGGTRDRVSRSMLGSIRFRQPPLSEQRTIAAYLDRETAKIDALVTKVQEAIERLKELRQALISAAVTGKIDVRKSRR